MGQRKRSRPSNAAVQTAAYGRIATEALPEPGAPTDFLQVLNKSNVTYFRWDFTTGALIDVSESVERLLGYTRTELLCDPALADRMTHASFKPVLFELVARWAQAKPDHLDFQGHYVSKDGRDVWLEVSGVPEYSPRGELLGVQALAVDVTETVEALRSAEEARERYLKTFRSAPFPMILYDPETLLVIEANASACVTYGVDPLEFAGSFFDEWLAPEEWPAREERLRRAAEDHPVNIISRMMHRKADGTLFPVQLATVELGGTREERPLRLAVVRDLTESEITESFLRLMRTAAELASDGFVLLDRSRRAVFANAACLRATGYSPEELQGQDLGQLAAPGWDQVWWKGIDASGRGQVWTGRVEFRHPELGANLLRVEIHPVTTTGSTVTHFVARLEPTTPKHPLRVDDDDGD